MARKAKKAEKGWGLIGRGFAGWHAARENCSSSGGSLMPYKYWTGEECSGYLAEACEGCLVYDAEACEANAEAREAFISLVISGPMCDPSIAPDAINRLGEGTRKSALEMLPGLSGTFATYARLAQDETFSGLDKVGIGIYEALLRRIPGIKIGHVHAGNVVWE